MTKEIQTQLEHDITHINTKRINATKKFKELEQKKKKTPNEWDKQVEYREEKEKEEKNLVVKENDLFLIKMQDKNLRGKLK